MSLHDPPAAPLQYLPMKHLSKVLAVRLYCEPRQILVGEWSLRRCGEGGLQYMGACWVC